MTRVRVLWLADGLGRGGAPSLLLPLARAIDGSRVEIEVAYRRPRRTALVAALEAEGIRTHCLARSGLHWTSALRVLLAERRYDVVHSHAPLPGAAARLLAPRGTVLLHTEHRTWDRYRPATRWANWATLGRNTRVWAVSDEVASSIQVPVSRNPTPVEVMLHGVDVETVSRGGAARRVARERLGFDDGHFVYGTVGDVPPGKDRGTMLRAFAEVHRTLPRSRLVVVGAALRERQLRGLAHELGVDRAVHLVSAGDDLPGLLPGFDTLVLSDAHDGHSVAVVESLAAGVPVVATRVGGIPELVVHGEYGVLVPPRDPGSLAVAMRCLARDEGVRGRLTAAGPVRAADFGIRPAATRLTGQYLVLGGRCERAAAGLTVR
jgi:glycosyltransferase involved in cell wall biosynthesis